MTNQPLLPTRYAHWFAVLVLVLITLVLWPAAALYAQPDNAADLLRGASRQEGYLPLLYQPQSGKVLLQVTRLDQPLLYQTALVSGVGSNDIGLDRGQLGQTRVVRFRRAGNKVLLIQDNLAYRADSDDAQEVRAVREAFAQSVLAGLEVVAELQGAPVVDLSPLLFADSHGIAARLAAQEQGTYSLDPSSSAVFPQQLLNFPGNTIVQVLLTYQGQKPGEWVSSVTPTPERISVTYMHQFTGLPDDGYRPRVYHPRSGYFGVNYRDYAAPLGAALERRFLVRHRLQWRDGETVPADFDGAARPVAEPIVYYLDPGTPEPVRSALLEGASWWREAFAAAGFADAFRVEILPADAHPLDIRYNVIQWVHRATRGWSYGASVVDPRSGEIIKGHVTLGSLRVRQDMLIAEALTAPFSDGVTVSEAARDMALARLRQLAAHEVGHTLGLSHNFAASSSGDASVMDYPHPNLYLDDNGQVQLDRAYARGVSPWDRWAIRYGYTPFSADTEDEGLQRLLQEADAQAFLFLSDPDARVSGSATPNAHLWDNGNGPVQRLQELIAIRASGLRHFNQNVLPPGTPVHEMEQRLVPVYLLHRYQVEAVAKLLGGVVYDHRLRGDTFNGVIAVSDTQQEAALNALLATLDSGFLKLPAGLLGQIPPPAEGYQRSREYFTHTTAPTFDHLAPARAAMALSLKELLHPVRAARMNDQHLQDENLPNFGWVLDRLHQRLQAPAADAYTAAIDAELAWQIVQRLFVLAGDQTPGVQVRAQAGQSLDHILNHVLKRMAPATRKLVQDYLENRIEAYWKAQLPKLEEAQPEPTVPPGSPIGMAWW